jgi:fatty acid desaturase
MGILQVWLFCYKPVTERMNKPTDSKLRDYGLTGRDGRLAVERGLAGAAWYRSPIPRKRLKELMRRRDGPAIRDTMIWLAALGLTGGLAWHFWGSWWAVPFFTAYGVLYGSSSDSRWHECGHGTAFSTRWMNAAVYHLACFMLVRDPTVSRWSHTRHHTDTLIVGRDPEIVVQRPPNLVALLLNLLAIRSGIAAFGKMLLHTAERLTADEATFIPDSERGKVYLVARLWVLVYAAVIASCFYWGTLLPAMLVGLPSFYGGWLLLVFGLTQHAGLAEDVLDHRLNSRTVYMNPVFRFLYWNMNYHVEHHMFPMVPYHALPALQAALKDDMPPAYDGLWAAYREIIPALLRQAREPAWFVERKLPPGATPMASPTAAAG